MKISIKLVAAIVMLSAQAVYAEHSDNLRSVKEIEETSAVLGFLGVRDDDRWGRGRDRDRDRWRHDRCRRYGGDYCSRPNPGYPGRRPYPGYPGRPNPGYPGRPYPPTPGYPIRDYYVCYAANMRGDYFSAVDRSPRYAQEMAMQNCYRNSFRCEARGCEYY